MPGLAGPGVGFLTSLSGRRRVLQAALVPGAFQAAVQLQRRARTDIAVEDFAVVADRLDDVVGPIVGEAHPLTQLLGDAQQALVSGSAFGLSAPFSAFT